MTVGRRQLLAAASLLAHAGLAWLFLSHATAEPSFLDPGAVGVALVAGAATDKSPAPAKPTPPSPPEAAPPRPTPAIDPQYLDEAPQPKDMDPSRDPVALAVTASAASGETCSLTQWLQQALQAEPAVQAALPAIPRPSLSVANALMLWDATWIEPDRRAYHEVTALRRALVAGVMGAPEACRNQPIRGPELIILTDGQTTTVLAVGSGEWRWSDLLTDASGASQF